MRHYIVFLKKEIVESIKTYKLFSVLIVFSLLGVLSPFAAKLTPKILSTLIPEGNQMVLPEPTVFDAWAQFFKNMNQMGIIVTILFFSGILIAELSRGTLVNVLTKGLSRRTVILSKFSSMAIIWTTALLLSFFLTAAYTTALFENDGVSHLLFSLACLWLFGVFLFSVQIFASTLVSTNYGTLIIVGAAVIGCTLLKLIPHFEKYNPMLLSTKNMDLIKNVVKPNELFLSFGVTTGLIVILLCMSVVLFARKEIR